MARPAFFASTIGALLLGISALACCHVRATETSPNRVNKFLDVIREAAPGLPGYTVYRPANMKGKERYPVVAWSNGACTASNDAHLYFLMQIAAHGFVVVAAGSPEVSSGPGGIATQDRLSNVIDWVTGKGKEAPDYQSHLDADRIATAGHSCGGIDAIWTGANDRRVKAIVSMNSGCFPEGSNGGASGPLAACQKALNSLNGPILFLAGGTTDVAYDNSVQNYALVSSVPAALASHATAGHGGFFGGTTSRTVQLQAVQAVVGFLDATLNDNRVALGFLVGPAAGLGQLSDWTVNSKAF